MTDRHTDRQTHRQRDLHSEQTMPVREGGHAVGTASQLIFRIGAGAPVGLPMEGSDVAVPVNGRVLLKTLHGVPEVLHLLTCQGQDVTAHVLHVFKRDVVVIMNCGKRVEWMKRMWVGYGVYMGNYDSCLYTRTCGHRSETNR